MGWKTETGGMKIVIEVYQLKRVAVEEIAARWHSFVPAVVVAKS
jgi:hypothetical protein